MNSTTNNTGALSPHDIRRLALFLCALLTVVAVGVAEGASTSGNRITDIRFWQSPEEAQIVVDLAAPSQVEPMQQLSDGTWFFDITQTRFKPGQQRYDLNNQFLQAITFQEHGRGLVRVLFRVPQGIRPRVFVLPATPPAKPDRVVIFLREPEERQLERELRWRADRDRFRSQNVQVVVLDPGHGGEDPGARHNGIIEKNLVLQVAKMVKAYFDRDPRYKAVLTRTGDYIIPLERRPQIAEGLGAAVFVSIHANYNRSSRFQGAEVYYDSPSGASGQAEKLMEEYENNQDAIGGVEAAPRVMPNKAEIVAAQAMNMNRSRQLAEWVERRFATMPGLTSRGVRRAGFRVLHSLSIPSILVELAYMSNPSDVALLHDKNMRWRMAYVIYKGIKDFVENRVQEGMDRSYIEYLQNAQARAKAPARPSVRAAATYKVKPGDTLSAIAGRCRVALADLMAINGLSKGSSLRAGQVLKIPESRSRSRRR